MLKTPLSASRWAPTPSANNKGTKNNDASSSSHINNSPLPSSSSSAHPFSKLERANAPIQGDGDDLEKVTRLIDRLQWKSAHLNISAEQAELSPYNGGISTERMFKIDFFEYYGLLERILMSLLVIGRVSLRGLGQSGNASESIIGSLDRDNPVQIRLQLERFYTSKHRYHVSLVDEFKKSSNPYCSLLGAEEMQKLLHKARDLRNRWKDAEEHADGQDNRGANVLLDRVEMEAMLHTIVAKLREAIDLATVVSKNAGPTSSILEAGHASDGDVEMADVPFDAMMELYD